jgi:hypothetical protein
LSISIIGVSVVFFNFNQGCFLPGKGTQAADLLVDFDQFLRQRLKAAKLGNFLFGFAYRGGRRKGLGDRLACDFLRELPMRAVSRVVRLRTMAVGFATTSGDGGNRTRLKVTELGELLQEMATAVQQYGQGVGHEELQVMISRIILK